MARGGAGGTPPCVRAPGRPCAGGSVAVARNTSPSVRAWQLHAWVRAGCGMRAPRAALPLPPPLLLLLLLGPAARAAPRDGVLRYGARERGVGAPSRGRTQAGLCG